MSFQRPPPGGKALLTRLIEHQSRQGRTYLRGWLGGSALLAFESDGLDEQGRKVWDLYVAEPRSLPGAPKQAKLPLNRQPFAPGRGYE
jgi:hypothetical protein